MSNQDPLIEMAQTLGRIEGLVEGLAGPEGRVTKLEDSQTRNFWVSIAIVPTIGILHAIARKLGVNV